MFKKKDSEQAKNKKPIDKKPSKKAAKPKKEKAPIEKKLKEKKQKKEKMPRQKAAPKEGGGKKTVVLAVILIVILIGAIASAFYPSIIGNKKQTVPTSFSPKKAGAEKIRTLPARKPGETPAPRLHKIDEETGETPDAMATEIASSAPPALRTPVQPSIPPNKNVATPTPSMIPSTLPAVGSGTLIPPQAARRPIVVRVPPIKEVLPSIAGSPEKFEKSSYKPPVTIVVEKPAQEIETVTTGITVAKNPKRKTPRFNKNTDERKTIIDEKDNIFIPKNSMDDLFSWNDGKSFGNSKSLTKKSPDTRYSTVSDINSELKMEKEYFMVLVKESNDVDELRRIATNLKISTPAPEIKATVSFGRPVYWLTVGHYTSEYKAFNKAYEIRDKGYPTTIVSEKVYY